MLFLDPAEAMLEAEQKEVTRRLHSVEPYVLMLVHPVGDGDQ